MPTRVAIVLLPLLVILLVYLTLRGFGTRTSPVEQVKVERPRYVLKGAEWTRYDEQGQPEVRATALSIDYFDDKSARLNTLEMDRLGGGNGPWHLSAATGVMPANQERMQLGRPVTVTGDLQDLGPVRIVSDTLWVDFERKEIHTGDSVLLSGEGRNARATGLRADWNGERVQLLQDVHVDYAPRRRS